MINKTHPPVFWHFSLAITSFLFIFLLIFAMIFQEIKLSLVMMGLIFIIIILVSIRLIKSEIKEFIRPTKWKIILFLLLMLLILGIHYEMHIIQDRSFMPTICREGTESFNLFGIRHTCATGIETFFIIISEIFGLPIFSYLLSCFTIFSFNKIKEKRRWILSFASSILVFTVIFLFYALLIYSRID